MKNKIGKAFRYAFPYSLPIMAGYLILGFGFGLLLQSKGYNVIWALIMSVFIYAGSMQYVTIDLLASGAGLLATAIMTFMVNARHLFYGLSMIVKYRDMGKAKPYMIFGLTDECYSVVSHVDVPEDIDKKYFYFIFTLLNQLYWIAGSVAGSLFGALVPINTKGVDFSMTALFVVIVVDNLMKKGNRLTSFIGIGATTICLLIFGAENFLIPSMIAIAALLVVLRPVLDKDRSENGLSAGQAEACLKDEAGAEEVSYE